MNTPKLASGKALRKLLPRSAQKECVMDVKRPSVLQMIKLSNRDRLPELIPIRHARMSVSPFTFYRGAANIMAYDLSKTPRTDIQVQAIGDCHLMNFGGFATPERLLVFDVNDFDETYPCSWEWDIKRLATSFALAAREKKLDKASVQEIVMTVAASYREHIMAFSQMGILELWYMKFDVETERNNTQNPVMKQFWDDALAKADKETSQRIFYKLAQNVSGNFEIADQPPLIYHPFNLAEEKKLIKTFLNGYIQSLQPDRRYLLSKYKLVDIAVKVVGVGSVGTRCYVVLLLSENNEPLFLQIKEARQSVLEPYTAPSAYSHHGERVVQGQRLVQAASDIFLGWTTGMNRRYFYLRQLRDKKIAPDVAHFDKDLLTGYARACGRMLARAHAKTGDALSLAGYMGKSAALDEALTAFALTYADQTEKDYDDFMKAIKAGKLPVEKATSPTPAK